MLEKYLKELEKLEPERYVFIFSREAGKEEDLPEDPDEQLEVILSAFHSVSEVVNKDLGEIIEGAEDTVDESIDKYHSILIASYQQLQDVIDILDEREWSKKQGKKIDKILTYPQRPDFGEDFDEVNRQLNIILNLSPVSPIKEDSEKRDTMTGRFLEEVGHKLNFLRWAISNYIESIGLIAEDAETEAQDIKVDILDRAASLEELGKEFDGFTEKVVEALHVVESMEEEERLEYIEENIHILDMVLEPNKQIFRGVWMHDRNSQ